VFLYWFHIPFDPKKMVVKGYLLLNQQGSIIVSNICINLFSLFSIRFSFFLFLLNGSGLSLLLKIVSMFFAAFRFLSWLIKHPLVAHCF